VKVEFTEVTEKQWHLVSTNKSSSGLRVQAVQATLELVRPEANMVTLSYREHQPNGWEPLPVDARAAVRYLLDIGKSRTGEPLAQWNISLSSNDSHVWKMLQAYMPYDESATIRNFNAVIWRWQGTSGRIAVYLSAQQAQKFEVLYTRKFTITPVEDAQVEHGPMSSVVGRGGSTRRFGAWVNRKTQESAGGAPWSLLGLAGMAAIFGAVFGGIANEVVNFSAEPGVAGAQIGIALFGTYVLWAVFIDWMYRKKHDDLE
jgi:hypothetical protein